MSFDIPPIHIPDNSPEAKIIEAIVGRDHVSPEEVVRRALRSMTLQATPPTNAILAGRGLFSSPEDVAALDAAVNLAYEERRKPSSRPTGL